MTVPERIRVLLVDDHDMVRQGLVVSPSTIKFHVSNILSKLGVARRSEAVALAVRRHLDT